MIFQGFLSLSRILLIFLAVDTITARQTDSEPPKSLDVEGMQMIRVNTGTFRMGAPACLTSEPYEGLRTVQITKFSILERLK